MSKLKENHKTALSVKKNDMGKSMNSTLFVLMTSLCIYKLEFSSYDDIDRYNH